MGYATPELSLGLNSRNLGQFVLRIKACIPASSYSDVRGKMNECAQFCALSLIHKSLLIFVVCGKHNEKPETSLTIDDWFEEIYIYAPVDMQPRRSTINATVWSDGAACVIKIDVGSLCGIIIIIIFYISIMRKIRQ